MKSPFNFAVLTTMDEVRIMANVFLAYEQKKIPLLSVYMKSKDVSRYLAAGGFVGG